MPELPEVQAHAERLSAQFSGRVLHRVVPFNLATLKTFLPNPDPAIGEPLREVRRRGKYLLLDFGAVHYLVHLMQTGRLRVDTTPSAKPRNGMVRFEFDEGPALLLTEAGRERRAGVWQVATDALAGPPLDRLGPEALSFTAASLVDAFEADNMRLHGFLRDQRRIAGLGRMLANEVCHRAKVSPFAMTRSLGESGAANIIDAIQITVDEALAHERSLDAMSSSADRPGRVHHRVGQPCLECGEVIRSVTYSGYTVAYCPGCQTGGKVLADNTTSKFLK